MTSVFSIILFSIALARLNFQALAHQSNSSRISRTSSEQDAVLARQNFQVLTHQSNWNRWGRNQLDSATIPVQRNQTQQQPTPPKDLEKSARIDPARKWFDKDALMAAQTDWAGSEQNRIDKKTTSTEHFEYLITEMKAHQNTIEFLRDAATAMMTALKDTWGAEVESAMKMSTERLEPLRDADKLFQYHFTGGGLLGFLHDRINENPDMLLSHRNEEMLGQMIANGELSWSLHKRLANAAMQYNSVSKNDTVRQVKEKMDKRKAWERRKMLNHRRRQLNVWAALGYDDLARRERERSAIAS